ncbi:C2H2-type zinc finger protein [Haladaptatus caseinilyticus]
MSNDPHQCKVCGATFCTERKLRKHMREQGLVD